ncbi:MAG: L-seryl-tRNA(Sec) selenium transferase [Phycisphaerae bacterium]|nr:L-seryl-tRNA(Sec) selenium transferase [Phycisphaerae bacterium]
MTPEQKAKLRELPSVDDLLNEEEVGDWIAASSHALVVESLREAVELVRRRILEEDGEVAVERRAILDVAEDIFARRTIPSLRRVINATGIILHTGLGRAPLCSEAIESIVEAVGGYCNLELELETGKRGRRERHVEGLIRRVTGAEAGLVVNNNAAATLLILNTLARGREVIVSRGQLVEIGGSFRLPDVMLASGARLCEVGTTNRTRLDDYEQAVNDDTIALMHVHTSNYRIIGFAEQTPIAELVTLARHFHLIVIDDLGSGALIDVTTLGLPAEPMPAASIEAGADIVCFSGDKLLGGPQAGIIAGRKDLIECIRSNPLMRTYRTGKLTLLALEATLRQYIDAEKAAQNVPVLAMIATDTDVLAERARTLCELLEQTVPGESFYVCSDTAYVGGGSLPGAEIASVCVQWRPKQVKLSTAVQLLREGEVPIVARVHDDAICFDLRTIIDDDFEDLAIGVADNIEDDR